MTSATISDPMDRHNLIFGIGVKSIVSPRRCIAHDNADVPKKMSFELVWNRRYRYDTKFHRLTMSALQDLQIDHADM
jgi:hypothetical protein